MIKQVAVQMRMIDKPSNAVKSICDVAIHFEEVGSIELSGFRVIDNGKGRWVSPPCRQGQTRWFDLVKLSGAVKSGVEQAILREYERRVKSPQID